MTRLIHCTDCGKRVDCEYEDRWTEKTPDGGLAEYVTIVCHRGHEWVRYVRQVKRGKHGQSKW